jgi:hypothetical protein
MSTCFKVNTQCATDVTQEKKDVGLNSQVRLAQKQLIGPTRQDDFNFHNLMFQ